MSDQPTPPEPAENPTPETEGSTPTETPAGAAPETPEIATPEAQSTPAPEAAVEGTVTEQAAATATPDEAAPIEAPTPTLAPDDKGGKFYWGTGRRKAAIARVRIRTGSGKFLIRDREIDDYFFDIRHRIDVVAPLKATNTYGKYDIFINVHGGGQMGQAGAIVMGVARALMKEDPTLEDTLRSGKFLTRDARKVERKKPGQPGARKRFQFSKR